MYRLERREDRESEDTDREVEGEGRGPRSKRDQERRDGEGTRKRLGPKVALGEAGDAGALDGARADGAARADGREPWVDALWLEAGKDRIDGLSATPRRGEERGGGRTWKACEQEGRRSRRVSPGASPEGGGGSKSSRQMVQLERDAGRERTGSETGSWRPAPRRRGGTVRY